MIRICFLLGGFTGGGIGRVTSILGNELAQDERFDIHMLTLFQTDDEPAYELSSVISTDSLLVQRLSMKRAILHGGVRRLRRYLKHNQIDILVACGALFFPIAALASKRTTAKCICWEHSNTANRSDHALQSLSRRVGALLADRVVTLTQEDRDAYVSSYWVKNVVHIYNPIDRALEETQSEYQLRSTMILSAGRLTYQKNYEKLVEVAETVLPRNPQWTWHIFGEGSQRGSIQNMIDQRGLSSRVLLQGASQTLYQEYGKYAMLVLTSRWEGFPMVLLEASASGLPIVSFDVHTGPREIVVDGSTGFLIEAFDAPSMADAIQRLIDDPELRKRMSDAARARSARFNLDRVIRQWKDLCMEICP